MKYFRPAYVVTYFSNAVLGHSASLILDEMTDNLTKTQRSYCMSRVKGKDTLLEVKLRSELHRRGYRFRKHVSYLPGKPDIVFPSRKVVIFIDGDFWHGWRYPKWRDTLSEFWRTKIEKNRARDQRNLRRLRLLGWTVIRVWQHQVDRDFDNTIKRIMAALQT